MLMEKCTEGQRELHCVFVDLEKTYGRVPREQLCYCMRKSGKAEKDVPLILDMFERSETALRYAVELQKVSKSGRTAAGISAKSFFVCCDYG